MTVLLIMQEFSPGSHWTSSQVRRTHARAHTLTHPHLHPLCIVLAVSGFSVRGSSSCWFSSWDVGSRGRVIPDHLQSSRWGRPINSQRSLSHSENSSHWCWPWPLTWEQFWVEPSSFFFSSRWMCVGAENHPDVADWLHQILEDVQQHTHRLHTQVLTHMLFWHPLFLSCHASCDLRAAIWVWDWCRLDSPS